MAQIAVLSEILGEKNFSCGESMSACFSCSWRSFRTVGPPGCQRQIKNNKPLPPEAHCPFVERACLFRQMYYRIAFFYMVLFACCTMRITREPRWIQNTEPNQKLWPLSRPAIIPTALKENHWPRSAASP